MSEFLGNSAFFSILISILAFELGSQIKNKLKLAVFNPLLIAIVTVMAVLTVLDIEYETYKQSAQFLSWLLTPATVCLAFPLYEQLSLLKKNAKAILAGILAGVLSSLTCILLMALAFGLTYEQYVTLLPKSITTAIGMGVCEELGGYVTITVASIVVTGIIGNVLAEFLCRIFRITDPVAKGIAIGSSSHALGTVKAIEIGEVEGAMSSLSIAVSGLITVVLASVYAQFL